MFKEFAIHPVFSIRHLLSKYASWVWSSLWGAFIALNLINFRSLDLVFIVFAVIILIQTSDFAWKNLSEQFGLSPNALNICTGVFLLCGIIGLSNSPTSFAHKMDVALQVRWILGFYCSYAIGQYTKNRNIDLELQSILFPITLTYLLYRHYDSAAHILFNSHQRFQGFFENTNHLAMALVMPFGLYIGFLAFTKKFSPCKSAIVFCIQLMTLLLLGIALLATFSRTSWIGAAAILCVALILTKNRLFIYTCVGFLIGAAFLFALNHGFQERIIGTRDLSATGIEAGRLSVWKASWSIFLENPLFGVGFDHSQFHYPSHYSNLGISKDYIVGHAHNQFLQTLSETGIIGLFSYICILIMAATYFFKRITLPDLRDRQIALTGLLIIVGLFFMSFTDAPLRLQEVRNYALLIGGFSYGYLARNQG